MGYVEEMIVHGAVKLPVQSSSLGLFKKSVLASGLSRRAGNAFLYLSCAIMWVAHGCHHCLLPGPFTATSCLRKQARDCDLEAGRAWLAPAQVGLVQMRT